MDDDRQARVALLVERYERGLDLWTGEPCIEAATEARRRFRQRKGKGHQFVPPPLPPSPATVISGVAARNAVAAALKAMQGQQMQRKDAGSAS